jgi:hypothetical protein
MFLLVPCAICVGIIPADDARTASGLPKVPAVETLLLEPIDLENICIWVPGVKIGPEINQACLTRTGYSRSAVLPAIVDHTKTESCPEEVARLLAEHTAGYYEGSLPLTILGGWCWEYSYSLCQFESSSFDLHRKGGSWENCWEAILNESAGSIAAKWVHICDSNDWTTKSENGKPRSNIEIRTFSAMRTRDGYPKERQF